MWKYYWCTCYVCMLVFVILYLQYCDLYNCTRAKWRDFWLDLTCEPMPPTGISSPTMNITSLATSLPSLQLAMVLWMKTLQRTSPTRSSSPRLAASTASRLRWKMCIMKCTLSCLIPLSVILSNATICSMPCPQSPVSNARQTGPLPGVMYDDAHLQNAWLPLHSSRGHLLLGVILKHLLA